MARKSRWQQFADSFNSVYGTFNNAFKNIESTRVMNKEFEDEQGNALEGSALDRARYKALSDIYTKYGDAAGGLALRSNAAALESTTFENDLNRELRPEILAQRGALKSGLMGSQINSNNASATNSMSTARRRDALLPGEIEGQGLLNDGRRIGNETSALGLSLARDTYVSNVDEARARAERAEADARLAGTNADVNEATANDQIRKAGAEADSAESDATVKGVNANIALETQDESVAATLAELRAQQQEAQTRGLTAQSNEQVLLQDERDRSIAQEIIAESMRMDFDTPEAASAYVIDRLGSSDMTIGSRLQYAEAINKFGLERLGSRAAELTSQAREAYRSGGLPALADLYDGVQDGANGEVFRDGDMVGVTVDYGDGMPVVIAQASGPGAEDRVAAMVAERFGDPMTGMEMAARELEFKEKQAGIANTEATTRLRDAQADAVGGDAEQVAARTELLRAQTDQVLLDIEQAKGGLGASEKIAKEGLSDLLTSDAFLFIQEDDPETANAIVTDYMKRTGLLKPAPTNAASDPAPDGIPQQVWDRMPEEDKALFK